MKRSGFLFLFSLFAFLISCGGGGGSGGGQETIYQAIKDVDTGDQVADSEIGTGSHNRRIVRTRMTIVFYPSATGQQLNDLLDSLGATITLSLAGTRSVVVRIPDPGTMSNYWDIVASVEAEPYVQFVWEGEIPVLAALPGNYSQDPPSLAELEYIDHHLAVRGHAAWNARGAIGSAPKVFIDDNFGLGSPVNETIDYFGGGFAISGTTDRHGYMVAGVVAGTFGTHDVTGLYPDTVELWVKDWTESPNADWGTTMHALLNEMRSQSGKMVVNSSYQYECTGVGGTCIDTALAKMRGELWTEYVRDIFNLEDRILHVTAAGNIRTPPGRDIRDAATSNPFASARLLPGLTYSDGVTPMDNLANTLVVENARHTSLDPSDDKPVVPECLEVDTFVGGDIAAIGTSVYSFLSADGSLPDEDTGTSYAAPQVAALAAYLWAVNPGLSVTEVITDLISTSRALPAVAGDARCSDWTDPAPVIDAYDALLALDGVGSPWPGTHPVRLAVLDGDGDGTFDEADIGLILDAFPGPAPGATPHPPDYGRFDLNGDGYTGDDHAAPFDLDRTGSAPNGPMVYTTVTQTILSQQVMFDEREATDLDVLCYYAYSPLYQGLSFERDDLLGSLCAPLTLIIGPHPDAPEASRGVQLAYANVKNYSIGTILGYDAAFDPPCLELEPRYLSVCLESDIPPEEQLNCDEDPFLGGGLDLPSSSSWAASTSYTPPAPHTEELTARSSATLFTGREIRFSVDAEVSGSTDGRKVYDWQWYEGFNVSAGGMLGAPSGMPSTTYLDITNPHASDITIEISWDAAGSWDGSGHRTPDSNEELMISWHLLGLVRVSGIQPCARYGVSPVASGRFDKYYHYQASGPGTPTIETIDYGYPGSVTFAVPPGRHQYRLDIWLQVQVDCFADPHFGTGGTGTGQGIAPISAQAQATFTIRNLGP